MQKAKGKITKWIAPVSFCFDTQRRNKHGKMRAVPLVHFAFCTLPFALFFFLAILFPSLSSGQQPPPYASINRNAITYNGPGREASDDLPGTEVRIGLLLPLTGPCQGVGETLRRAAQMAVDDESADSLPAHRLALVTRDESGPWGQASTQIVKLVFDDQAVALITSGDGSSAHLAEQMGNKVGVPILTLSSDSTTTEINLPWIFRMGPSDTVQAAVFARDIYQNRKLQRVLLLTQNDRDGMMGGAAFIKAAGALTAVAPTQVMVDPEKQTEELNTEDVASSQAVVIWADAPTAELLVAGLNKMQPSVLVYLCRKGAEGDSGDAGHLPTLGGNKNGVPWIAGAPEGSEAHADFCRRYRQRFGVDPGMGAAESYDAVRILAASLRKSGTNRARLRDSLAAISSYAGASGLVSFDHAGNDTSRISLLESR